MLPFRGLSVCLSVTFVHCAQTAEDIDIISFAYDSPIVSSTLCENLAYIGLPILPQILSQSDPPLFPLSVGEIRWQIAAEWLEIAQWS